MLTIVDFVLKMADYILKMADFILTSGRLHRSPAPDPAYRPSPLPRIGAKNGSERLEMRWKNARKVNGRTGVALQLHEQLLVD